MEDEARAVSTGKATIPSDLGKAITARRQKKGWTQARLAKESGVDATEICRLESGQRQGASFKTVTGLAKAFGCTLDRMVRATEGRG